MIFTEVENVISFANFYALHQHKVAGVKIRLSKNSEHDEVSHGVECSQKATAFPCEERQISAGTGTPFLLCPL